MAGPLFCVESFMNPVVFPDHTVSANEEATGSDAFRVGTQRRSSANFWTPTTANQDAWLKVICDRIRAASYVALDGHNLSGHQVKLQGSNDGFTTSEDILDETVPSDVFAPSDMRTTPGTLLEDGSWLRAFDTRAYKDWRLYVPAMGAGEKPEITGLYLGLGWAPEKPQAFPTSPGGRDLQYAEVQADNVWSAAGRPAKRYQTEITLRLADYAEYDLARYHIEALAFRGRPLWYVPDQARAERAWFGIVPPGSWAFGRQRGWGYDQVTFRLVEHAPRMLETI